MKFQGEVMRSRKFQDTLTVPLTREIHSVKNTGIPGVVEVREVSCNCTDCLNNVKPCINASHVDDWKCFPCSESAQKKCKLGPNVMWKTPYDLHYYRETIGTSFVHKTCSQLQEEDFEIKTMASEL